MVSPSSWVVPPNTIDDDLTEEERFELRLGRAKYLRRLEEKVREEAGHPLYDPSIYSITPASWAEEIREFVCHYIKIHLTSWKNRDKKGLEKRFKRDLVRGIKSLIEREFQYQRYGYRKHLSSRPIDGYKHFRQLDRAARLTYHQARQDILHCAPKVSEVVFGTIEGTIEEFPGIRRPKLS